MRNFGVCAAIGNVIRRALESWQNGRKMLKYTMLLMAFVLFCVARLLPTGEALPSSADVKLVVRLILELSCGFLAWLVVHRCLTSASSTTSAYSTKLANMLAAASASLIIASWAVQRLLSLGLLGVGAFIGSAVVTRNAEVGAVVLSDVILALCLSCLAFRFLDAVHAGEDRGEMASKVLCSLGLGLCSAASSITWLIWNTVLGIQRFGGVAVAASFDRIILVLYMTSAVLILVAVAWLFRGGLRRIRLGPHSRPERDIDIQDGLISEQSHSSVRISECCGLAGGTIMAVCACLVTLVWTRYGLDLGDEGFYLLNMSDPGRTMSILSFGKVYSIFYELANGHIVLMRSFNVLLTFVCGFIFMLSVVSHSADLLCCPSSLRVIPRVLLSLSLASTVLVYFQFEGWMTPSYNSLTLQGLCLSTAGMILLRRKLSISVLMGAVLMSSGVVICFLGKPTTAVLVWISMSVYLLVSRHTTIRQYAIISIAAAVLLLMALQWIDGSLYGAFSRYCIAREESMLLWSGESLRGRLDVSRWINLYNRQLFGLALCLVTTSVLISIGKASLLVPVSLCLLLILGMLGSNPVDYGFSVLLLGIAAVSHRSLSTSKWTAGSISVSCMCMFFIMGLLFWLGVFGRRFGFAHNQPLLMFAIPCGVSLACIAARGSLFCRGITPAVIALPAILLLMPFVFHGGSSGGVWQYAGTAGIFWVAAGVTLLVGLNRNSILRTVTLLALISQTIVGGITIAGLVRPFEGCSAVWLDAPAGAKIKVRQDVADFLVPLIKIATDNGFAAGDPMINLSQNSAVAYFLGATELGTFLPSPALCPGAEAYTHSRLSRENAYDLGRAWVIQRENNDPNYLSSEMLLRHGIDLKSDYKVLGSFVEPIQQGRVYLFAPLSSTAE